MLRFDPDPRVLIALTHTPLKPLDALSELIDNGIDSVRSAAVQGQPIRHPLVEVVIPGLAEVRRGEGLVRVADNGAGLDREELANALRAGYSSNNRYDTLGLFGMGFNIATGKLGRRTIVTTARQADDFALQVEIDLPQVVRSRKFEAPVNSIAKPAGFEHGTIIQVDQWWPSGDPNAGFVADLAGIAKPQLRLQVGRRYATILLKSEDGRIRVLLNGESVSGYEHCVWSGGRFVERQNWGMIPAQFNFDEVILTQHRCIYDGAVLDDQSNSCIECQRGAFRTVEERVKGWVGIQRFDDNNKFGIELIRNGRAIRVAEKDAFFNFIDELEAVKEYPTDQQTGRIVGEVQLDHVPVDFQKQDFQRSSEEWQRAMEYLRGGSLLPSKWVDGARNESPISKLFQGYRKVRNIGRLDMYMGRYDEHTRKAARIGREVEREYYERFLSHEPGYYDDARWWELVETAGTPPVLALEECIDCGFQNLPDSDICGDCGRILKSKACVSCGADIQKSATVCPDCGASQIPDVQEPWTCLVCAATNGVDDERCGRCDALRGEEDPTAIGVLRRAAESAEDLAFSARSFLMADGQPSDPLTAVVWRAATLKPQWDGERVPSIATRSPGKIEVFIDLAHPAFTQLGVHPEEAIAVEAAHYLYSLRSDLAGRPAHSVHTLSSQILRDVWGDELAAGPDKVRESIRALFSEVAQRLEGNPDASDFYADLDQFELREVTDRLISGGALDQLPELRANGGYLRHSSPSVIAKFFARKPESWFGTVWSAAPRAPPRAARALRTPTTARPEYPAPPSSRCPHHKSRRSTRAGAG